MHFKNQQIIPAAKTISQVDKAFASPYEYIVLLEVHISQLMPIKREADRVGKKMIIHADLIHGLKTDNFAADFLCNEIKPAGIISTRSNMILKAKKNGIIAIQRIFLIDTIALEKSYSLIEKTAPDYIELLPGVIPNMIAEVYERTNIPVITGGLIREKSEIRDALAAGAIAITTSDKNLWK
ncbi:glycerol-3-phosphate responsive antiterminator [Kurthia sibirica]|uniref:Glycerol uptake operon antiterminator regulatory protein n=1 Tax=Kurthia sibirica TaxID=202750 RepID=A0A2U3AHV7_9BACL|nr:glycerol-3-phosphate responsive antiterminator [Kurthia sibirica]PWI24129.1 glycerol-3-phosphate responsive antiterminator GlpP [Kurthia sibirica]GEK35293.1 glycerol uptake operon antiterminator regulatory protein [Kurthia sibirica]